jgi:hypothetical protein
MKEEKDWPKEFVVTKLTESLRKKNRREKENGSC